MDVSSQTGESKFALPAPFCSLQTLNGLDAGPVYLRVIFIGSANSNVNLFQKQPHRNFTSLLSGNLFTQSSCHLILTLTASHTIV